MSKTNNEDDSRTNSSFRIRTMPIAQSNESAMLFSSLESYEAYEGRHYLLHDLDPNGLGVPLFQFRLQTFGDPVIIVDKFVLLNVKDPPPESHYEIRKGSGDLLLYKFLFCKVYLRRHRKYSSWEMEFTNRFKDIGRYELIRSPKNHKGFIGTADGFDLSWRALNSHIKGEHELFVNYDDIYHLLNNGKTSSADNDCVGNSLSPQGLYLRNMEGQKVKRKRNYLFFLEPSDASDPKPLGLGIDSVPIVTEFLSLHGILLHCRIYEEMGDSGVEEAKTALPIQRPSAGTSIGFSMGPS